jgi:hypothetical protein
LATPEDEFSGRVLLEFLRMRSSHLVAVITEELHQIGWAEWLGLCDGRTMELIKAASAMPFSRMG